MLIKSNCLGAMDGKHIEIKKPGNGGSTFYNYKDFNSIVLLAACDSDYRFTMVDIGAPGKFSDGGVFAALTFGGKLQQEALEIPAPEALPGTNHTVPFCFLADEAFPLLPNVLRPFPGSNLCEELEIYNYRLSRGRRLIENSFGILAARWRIFQGPISASIPTIISIVKATICLHNYLLCKDMFTADLLYCPSSFVDYESGNGTVTTGQWRLLVQQNILQNFRMKGRKNCTQFAKNNRLSFVKYLNSKEGRVPWQNEMIRRGQLM